MLAGLGLVNRSRPAVDSQQRAGVVSFVLATLYALFLAWGERQWAIIPNATILEVVGGTVIIFVGALLALSVYRRWVNIDTAEFVGTRQVIAEVIGTFIVSATAAGVPIAVWQVIEITLRLLNHPAASNLCR
jgi:hypothetical protein